MFYDVQKRALVTKAFHPPSKRFSSKRKLKRSTSRHAVEPMVSYITEQLILVAPKPIMSAFFFFHLEARDDSSHTCAALSLLRALAYITDDYGVHPRGTSTHIEAETVAGLGVDFCEMCFQHQSRALDEGKSRREEAEESSQLNERRAPPV